MAESSRIVTVVIEVADLDRAVRLYREGFGVDLQTSRHNDDDRWIGGRHAAVSWTDGAFFHFALYQAKDDEPTRGVQVGFRVLDLEAAHARALAAGAELVHGPRDEPWGRSGRYRDYDGNVVELTQSPG